MKMTRQVAAATPVLLAALLLASASAASLSSQLGLAAPRRRLDLLRGGEADEDEPSSLDAAENRGLTRAEIAAKLSEIPAFCVTNEKGDVAMFRIKGDKGFKAAVLFFLEPDEAKAAMEALQQAMPDTKLKLTLHGLGAAFEHCLGWQQIKTSPMAAGVVDQADAAFFASSDPEPAKTPAGETVEMRIVGNHALVNTTKEDMVSLLAQNSIEAGAWTLPVFLCNQLQSKSVFPAFLKPSDLRKTWMAAGRKEEDIPEDIVVVDLRLLVAQMLTDANDWGRYHLVPSDEAVAFAAELQGAPPADADA